MDANAYVNPDNPSVLETIYHLKPEFFEKINLKKQKHNLQFSCDKLLDELFGLLTSRIHLLYECIKQCMDNEVFRLFLLYFNEFTAPEIVLNCLILASVHIEMLHKVIDYYFSRMCHPYLEINDFYDPIFNMISEDLRTYIKLENRKKIYGELLRFPVYIRCYAKKMIDPCMCCAKHDNDMILTKCNHRFCTPCFLKFRKTSDLCNCCQKPFDVISMYVCYFL